MPAIVQEKRLVLDKDPMKATEPGDLAYIFAKFFFRRWLKEKRWLTYHKFKRMVKDPTFDHEYERLFFPLTMLPYFMRADVDVAAEAALDEFYRKVMTRYENGKYQVNGEVFVETVEVKS